MIFGGDRLETTWPERREVRPRPPALSIVCDHWIHRYLQINHK